MGRDRTPIGIGREMEERVRESRREVQRSASVFAYILISE